MAEATEAPNQLEVFFSSSPLTYHGSLWEGFLGSWMMILVSEIGDKTFFIACLMAMRYSRLVVFIGAISALALMTILSALLGLIVPNVISVRVTQALATLLFLGFGIKILWDAFHDDDDGEDEKSEAAAAINRKRSTDGSPTSYSGSPSVSRWHMILNPVLIQAFTLTFVAEWGDRSQIATIALAAAKNPYGVTLGGICGHAICTGGAVLAGNLISSRISHRAVNLAGGIIFILFGVITAYQLFSHSHPIEADPSLAESIILTKVPKKQKNIK